MHDIITNQYLFQDILQYVAGSPINLDEKQSAPIIQSRDNGVVGDKTTRTVKPKEDDDAGAQLTTPIFKPKDYDNARDHKPKDDDAFDLEHYEDVTPTQASFRMITVST